MKISEIASIDFKDHGEGGNGVVIVRKCDDLVALCLSLEEGGDVEGVMNRATAEKLIEALQLAVTSG